MGNFDISPYRFTCYDPQPVILLQKYITSLLYKTTLTISIPSYEATGKMNVFAQAKNRESQDIYLLKGAQICPFGCSGRSVVKSCVDKQFYMPCNEATNVKQFIPF